MRKSDNQLNPLPASREVDAYLATLPPAPRAALEKLRCTILAAAPEAAETFTYRIPMYRDHGWLVGFAAFPSHLSFIVIKEKLVDAHAADLKRFAYNGSNIYFCPEKPLPESLVTELVKERVAENKVIAGR